MYAAQRPSALSTDQEVSGYVKLESLSSDSNLSTMLLFPKINLFLLSICLLVQTHFFQVNAQTWEVAAFEVDVSPPLGSPVAYAPARSITDPLLAKGIVIKSEAKPIVLCSVDYLGIANEGRDAWKKALAKAAKTTEDRVWVSAVHQHDGMRCDFTTERVLDEYGLGGTRYDMPLLKKIIRKVARSVKKADKNTETVTHIGMGKAKVEKVASNRRILGESDTVEIIRWSKTSDPAAIAAPEGLIDPWLRSVSFWNGDDAVAVITYYATHPQSYYGKGDVNAEFVGMARRARQDETGIPHIHFNGAGGNITAGKYNDGSEPVRPVLAARMEKGMREAFAATIKKPIGISLPDWKSKPIHLPLGEHLIERELRNKLAYPQLPDLQKFVAAKHLAWYLRTQQGHPILISTLKLAPGIQLLHLPGELFIEYQLAAQAMLPDGELCVAAYGEYGPGYIGTEISYSQGGYETSERASRVSAASEKVIMRAVEELLKE